MASVEEYLRREVGVPPLPPNQNNHKLEDSSTTDRGGQSGTYKDDVTTTSRGGKSGKINPDSSTTQRGGVDGDFDPEASTTKRPQPTKSEYGIPLVPTRGGTRGHYTNPTVERPIDHKEKIQIDTVRGGDSGEYDPNSTTAKRGGKKGEYDSQSSTTDRGGNPGEGDPNSAKTIRGGNNGVHNPESSQTTRGGQEGSFNLDVSAKRGGDLGSYQNPEAKRGGDKGFYDSDSSTRTRAGEEGKYLEDLNNRRPGQTSSELLDTTASRPEYLPYEPDEEIVAQRPPHHVTHQDIETDASRQSKVENTSKDLEATRPVSVNDAAISASGKESTLSQVSDIIRQLQFLAGSGLETLGGPVGSQVNSLKDKWVGKTYKQVTNTAMNAEDLYGYFKRMLKPETNLLARIPLDIGLRLLMQLQKQKNTTLRSLLIEGQDRLAKNPIKGSRESIEEYFGNSNTLLADLGLGKIVQDGVTGFNSNGSKITFCSDVVDRESWKAENRVKNSKGAYQDPYRKEEKEPTDYRKQFYGYKYDSNEEAIVKVALQVADRLRQATESNTLSTTNFGKGDPQDFWGGNYSRWSDFEMADNFYWGVSVKRPKNNPKYNEKSDSFPYTSLLPKFPGDFDNGWWPVTTCSFSKGALQSKSFTLPFFNLVIPNSGERPSGLKLTVLDNVRHDIRYYLEKYITTCFDVEKNLVLPYKNIIWCIEVYRFDRNISVLYKKGLLCILSNWQAAFDGATGHSEDELDLNFEIVGEYEIPENSSRNSTS